MDLVLDRIEQGVGAERHLYAMDLALRPGALTVVLGATRAGKTSLLRVMGGLDRPSSGRVLVDGIDVTGRPVRERNIAMVYQQFINYPSLTVAENIASPLRRQRAARGASPLRDDEIMARVQAMATRLRIEALLHRRPAELSGGQQQRVALARALVKRAPFVLLDEPLVNLDYKLREALREEMTQLFASGESTVVYATSDPTEALLLGGYTAVLDRGTLLQYGPTAEVFHTPHSLRVARAFSDPPMNLIAALATEAGAQLPNGDHWPITSPVVSAPHASRAPLAGPCTVGLRASALRLTPRAHDVAIASVVTLADIAGSDTFVHVTSAIGPLVAQCPGVHVVALGASLTLHVDRDRKFNRGGWSIGPGPLPREHR